MVKYADSPTTETAVEIGVPPSVVWPFLIDINVPGAFSQEFVRAEWIDGSVGPELNARFRGHNHHDVVGEWSATCTVTTMDDERAFEWTVGDVDFKAARWRFDLEPTDTGSRLKFTAEMGPAPSGLTAAIERMPDREDDIVARRLGEWNANMTRTIEGIRDLAEAAA